MNVREHPGLNTELNGASDDGGDDLGPEHGSWRYLHVVAKLEVGRERERLSHGDVSPGLEHHHGDRPSGEGIPNDQLCDYTTQKVSRKFSDKRKKTHFRPICWLVIAWMIPIGTVYTNAAETVGTCRPFEPLGTYRQ